MPTSAEATESITKDINEYIRALKASKRMGDQVAFHTVLDPCEARFAIPRKPWPEPIRAMLEASGIASLYSHQAEAIDLVREGRHVVTATPTASGKSMIYNLPVMERICANPKARALYLFPLKALAQDQLRAFFDMGERLPGVSPTAAIYDGDTTDYRRKKIRTEPPNVVFTNPDMLHLSMLPFHRSWAALFRDLEVVVVDEVHTYRGVMGTHMSQVFRRLRRLCDFYGASPVFVFSSATVGNPAELAAQLTGLEVGLVKETGAPRGKKHLVFLDTPQGPAQTAILLLKAALHRGLRTIVYAQSRKLTELISIWAGSRSGKFAHKISAYRAGFPAEERREIEARLSSGDLLAVISTSALELGIDVGDLDLCLLVGYPGTIVATWQRGGRVGRSGRDSAVALIAGEDALDQYFLRHPYDLLSREPESAVINPYNATILQRHLVCAAAELRLRADEPYLSEAPVSEAVAELEKTGDLLRNADGDELYARRKAPHREVDLRGTGSRYTIVCSETGKHHGDVDGFRAFRETHPGAVYIHNGRLFLVESLNLDTRTVRVRPARVDYYTRVRADKDTEILEIYESRSARGTRVYTGRLKVTDQVTGYEERRIHGRKKLKVVPLILPPQIFETEGLWFEIPTEVRKRAEAQYLHFMGGIHAVEHAAIGIFPLLVMSDRNDLGGISTPFHPQVGRAAIFIYDALPGGAGLTRQAFRRAESLFETTFKAIRDCGCEFGCPSCVHSPKCGSGNRPIDKAAAIFVLEGIRNGVPNPSAAFFTGSGGSDLPETAGAKLPKLNDALKPKSGSSAFPTDAKLIDSGVSEPKVTPFQPTDTPTAGAPKRFGVLDLETRRSADEVGGWHKADLMGISCVVVYDSETDRFHEYLQDQVGELTEHLKQLDLVVGFNIRKFDYAVLSGRSGYDFRALPTLDILEEVQNRLGYRLSLDHLARNTLGAKKSADGLQALQWWKEGRIREIIDYCRIDVEVTRDLYIFGRENSYLLFRNKAGNRVRVPVSWR